NYRRDLSRAIKCDGDAESGNSSRKNKQELEKKNPLHVVESKEHINSSELLQLYNELKEGASISMTSSSSMIPISFPITSSLNDTEDQDEIPLNLYSFLMNLRSLLEANNVSHHVNQSSIMMTSAPERSGFPLTTYSYYNPYDFYLPIDEANTTTPTDDVSFGNFSD
ncbi:259_t:CDS:2, partial [Funneliformis mosseae]